MGELWDGTSYWSETQEQALRDREALRVLTCPKRRCRRQRACALGAIEGKRCPGLVTVPEPEGEDGRLLRWIYHELKLSLAEDESDDPALPAIQKAREKAAKRREALAVERAKRAVREGRVGTS
jgi:hypothetical protein